MHRPLRPHPPCLALAALFAAAPLGAGAAHAAPLPPFDRDIALVQYGADDVGRLGDHPSRRTLALLLHRIRLAHPRAIVLLDDLDTLGPRAEDAALAEEIGAGHVYLTAALSTYPPLSDRIEPRFTYRKSLSPDLTLRSSGTGAWLPVPPFRARAAGICFTDIASAHSVPLLERFAGVPVKSLYTCVAEALLRQPLGLVGRRSAAFGPYRIPVDDHGEIPLLTLPRTQPPTLHYTAVLDGAKRPAGLAGRVVLVSTSAGPAPVVEWGGGPISLQRIFLAGVSDLLERVQVAPDLAHR